MIYSYVFKVMIKYALSMCMKSTRYNITSLYYKLSCNNYKIKRLNLILKFDFVLCACSYHMGRGVSKRFVSLRF